MGLVVDVVKNLIWTIIRLECLLIKSILWWITGKYVTINANYKEGSYKETVQVLSIWARHKMGIIEQASGPDNFITVHSSFEDPEYVLKDNISLYYINKNEAVFVETDTGFHVTDSNKASFVKIAQFKYAKKLIIVPMHIFHKLGEQVGKTGAKIIFLHMTTRCGSTLLTQVFEETGKAMAYSEPDALNVATQLSGLTSEEELDRIITHAVNILCRPLDNKQIELYLLKFQRPTIAEMPRFLKLFPHSYNLFAYRDGLQVAKSLARASTGLPILRLIYVLGRTSHVLTKKMFEEMGISPVHFENKIASPIHFCSILWASSVRQYLDYREQGYPFAAIRYEDLIADSKYSFQKIYEYVGVPFDGAAIEKAFGKDSQRDSPISMNNLNIVKLDEFTDEVKKQTDDVCDSFGLPHFPDPYILPGTITTKQD